MRRALTSKQRRLNNTTRQREGHHKLRGGGQDGGGGGGQRGGKDGAEDGMEEWSDVRDGRQLSGSSVDEGGEVLAVGEVGVGTEASGAAATGIQLQHTGEETRRRKRGRRSIGRGTKRGRRPPPPLLLGSISGGHDEGRGERECRARRCSGYQRGGREQFEGVKEGREGGMDGKGRRNEREGERREWRAQSRLRGSGERGQVKDGG